MNKEEFLKELSLLLADIEEDDRKEALDYYNNYFDEAGKENEEKIISELGSPEKIAMEIKQSQIDSKSNNWEFSEKGYKDTSLDSKNEIIKVENNKEKQKMNLATKIVIGIIILLSLGLLKNLNIGFIDFILLIISFIIGISIFLPLFGVVMAMMGIGLFIAAIGHIATSASIGLLGFGSALIFLALGILSLWFGIKTFVYFIKKISKAITSAFRKKEA